MLFHDVRVPLENLIEIEGDGFMIARARLLVLKIAAMFGAIGTRDGRIDAMSFLAGSGR